MKRWTRKNKKADLDTLSAELGYSKAFCNLLVNRGLGDLEAIRHYIRPSASDLHPPWKMKGMEGAVGEIIDRIDEGAKIRIIGDYDVDGVCSTYLLVKSLRACGADVDYAIPDRVTDGYGINTDMVERCRTDGVDLIITCDNGISAHQAISLAKEYGIGTIVTDHHQVEMSGQDMVLPQADWIVNPKQTDCPYPFKGLCGAGVAYKVVTQLYEIIGMDMEGNPDFLAVTAMATVCDVVDLTDENRYLVKAGLKSMGRSNNKGLEALLEIYELENQEISSYHLGFILGPCLNAAGRLSHAASALALLFEEDQNRARNLAQELKALNEERKELTAQGVRLVLDKVEAEHENQRVLVVHESTIHESIAGIVAGRVREEKYRPTIVLTDTESCVKGSGRSIEGYDMYSELSRYRELYQGFGGHPMAVGLSMEEGNVPLLRDKLNETFPLSDEALIPVLSVDLFLPLRFAQEQFVEEVSLMEPYGKSNPTPIFADKGILFTGARIVGKQSNVLLLTIRDQRGLEYKGVLFQYSQVFDAYIEGKFGAGSMEDLLGRGKSEFDMDIVYQPQINEFRDKKSIQLIVKDYR